VTSIVSDVVGDQGENRHRTAVVFDSEAIPAMM